jgi:hypothetical protein
MSKIKKLTTQFEDSMVFSPKLEVTSKKRKLSEEGEKRVNEYTLEEAIKIVEKIQEEIDNLVVEDQYKKKIEKERKIIKNIFSDLIYMTVNGRINQNKINTSVVKAQNSLDEIKNTIPLPSTKEPSIQPKKKLSDNDCYLFSSKNDENDNDANKAFDKLGFTPEEIEKYLKNDPKLGKKKIILTLKVIDEIKKYYRNIDLYINELIPNENIESIDTEDKELEKLIRDYMDLYVLTSCDPVYISKNIIFKFNLELAGEFTRDVLKDMEIDNIEDEDIENFGLSYIADEIRENEKNKTELYSVGQLKKAYTNIAESFIIRNYDKIQGKVILEYLSFIRDKPVFALPTLLWIDTFHDFKEERIVKDKIDLNKILDYSCYKLYLNRHWFGLEKDDIYKDKNTDVNIGHYYNFDKLYQNSFFKFNKDKEVIGFHPDYRQTILKDIPEEYAKLLYNVSSIFISKLEFEGDLLYAYLLYNFNFELSKEGLLNNLKDVFWNQIDKDKIPYYAKDVDKGSGNFFKGSKVIIPASIFDANTSNSSKQIEDFVNVKKTTIKLANAYNFVYEFDNKSCQINLKYENDKSSYDLLTSPICNENISDEKVEENSIKEAIRTLSKTISKNNIYNEEHLDDLQDIFSTLTMLEKSVKDLYFSNGIVKLPKGKKGISPVEIVTIIIGLIQTIKKPKNNVFEPVISCKELDFWVSLKRIGDYGQILQCKQLDIPLFTTDSMQLLISIAACSSVVWSPDYTKILWYDSTQDSIMCNGLTDNKVICNKQRFDTLNYSETINKLLSLRTEDYRNELKRASNYEKYDTIIKEKLPDIPNIRNLNNKI